MKIGQFFEAERGAPEAPSFTTAIGPAEPDPYAQLQRYLPITAVDAAGRLLSENEAGRLGRLLSEAMSILAASKVEIGGIALATVRTDEEEGALVALVGRSFKVEKEADRLRTDIVKPLNDRVRAINNLINGAVAQLLARFGKSGEAARALAAYQRVKEDRLRRQREESNRAALEAAKRQGEAEERLAAATTVEARAVAAQEVERASSDQMLAELAQPQAMPHGVKTEDGKATWVPVWEVEVVDEAQVPREYLTVDMSKLRAAVKAGARSIPGANIFERESMRRGI